MLEADYISKSHKQINNKLRIKIITLDEYANKT